MSKNIHKLLNINILSIQVALPPAPQEFKVDCQKNPAIDFFVYFQYTLYHLLLLSRQV